jgi:UDP-GlcNAc:undecaprenyl-phosphate GlcNAc-1-phosphate transferase
LNLLVPLLSIAASAATTATAVWPLRRLARARGFVARPRADRFHDRTVPLLGGPACVLGLFAAVILAAMLGAGTRHAAAAEGRLLIAAIAGILGLSALGLRDDRRSLPPFPKAALEGLVLLAVLWIWQPSGRLAGLIPGSIAWAWAMLMVNAWNYLDHADGIFSATLVVSSAMVAAPCGGAIGGWVVPGLLWGLCGAGVGFLAWNKPPARVFLGDAGSLPLGFASILAGLAIFDRVPADLLGAGLAGQALPLSDFLLVTGVRLRAGRSPFVGGREHTGHRLTLRLGPRRAILVAGLAAAILCAIGFFAGSAPAVVAIGAVLLGTGILALLVGRLPSPDTPRPPATR